MTGNATNGTIDFNDGTAYELFMGRWSRAAGAPFLDWVAPPKHARWLEIGCGTGAFTEIVLRACLPSLIIAADLAVEQVDAAKRQLIDTRVDFQIADAHLLPFPNRSFDVVASALVMNFISDSRRGLHEMRRVARSGGIMAAYVWDFAAARAPNSYLALVLSRMGIDVPRIPGTDGSSLEYLKRSVEEAGFDDVATASFEIAVKFGDFEEYWLSQTPSFSSLTRIIAALSPSDRARLTALVKSQTALPDGTISCSARANAVKARVP